MLFSARRRSIFTLVAVFGTLLLSGAVYSRLRVQESRETREIAPSVTLLSVTTQTPNGPLRYWLVKSDKTRLKMGIEVADNRDVKKKKSVRDLAAQSNALVAVNGGFFAYEGAAVGAVKVDGEWERLPWKSRTALGWNEKDAQIASFSGNCRLNLTLANGEKRVENAALNGFALPGTHAAFSDGFAVLTTYFGSQWKAKPGEQAERIRDGQRVPHDRPELPAAMPILPDGFVLVARGKAIAMLPQIQRAEWKVETQPPLFDKFPQILGAGPLLVKDGIVKTTEIEEEFRPDVVERGPRTAVGFDAEGHTLFLVADGRQAASVGLTLPETAQLFRQLGAVQAMNLDGGSSTQLVLKGELINAPSGYDPINPLRPREVLVSNALTLKRR